MAFWTGYSPPLVGLPFWTARDLGICSPCLFDTGKTAFARLLLTIEPRLPRNTRYAVASRCPILVDRTAVARNPTAVSLSSSHIDDGSLNHVSLRESENEAGHRRTDQSQRGFRLLPAFRPVHHSRSLADTPPLTASRFATIIASGRPTPHSGRRTQRH